MSDPELDGWMPIRLYWQQAQPTVDWCYVGDERFTDPFFDQTIERRLRHPFNLLFRHQTPVEALIKKQTLHPGLQPDGFIFHMSRCGSTLISQMLAALPENIVISEAGPLDAVLRANFTDATINEERQTALFKAMVSAYGQPRSGERHYFIKFDAWHAMYLPLIARAFPSVPRIFVYRNPVEVMVSQLKREVSWMMTGELEPALLGLDKRAAAQMPREEYCARVLAKICRDALESQSRLLLLNYRQLPEAVCSLLPDYFRVNYTTADLELMRRAAQFDAKSPRLNFADDAPAKHHEATASIRQLAEQWLNPLYQQLEALRKDLGEGG